jgi:hypothetical protein
MASEAFVMRVKGTDTWLTPKWIIDSIGMSTLDPCGYAPGGIPFVKTAENMYEFEHLGQDGLKLPWRGTIYCNPPYSNPEPWLLKGIEHHMATGADVIFLVSVRTGTNWWKQVRRSTGINFIEKPLKFLNRIGQTQRQSPFPSCLVAFGEIAYERISNVPGLCVRVS